MENQAAQKSIEKTINGVDTERLFGTIDAIKETPSLAKFKFRTKNKWISGGHNRSSIKGFYGAGQEDTSRDKPFLLDSDEPHVLLGEDQAANPGEFLLHALAACLTSSLVYHAAAQGIKIDEVESTLEGDIDLHGFLGLSDTVRKGYENIRVNFKVKSDAPVEKLEEFSKFSPLLDIISNPVPVSVHIEKE